MRQMLVKPSVPPQQAAVQRTSAPGGRASRHAQAEDDLLAFLLISTWMLITGRTLRTDVPPGQLSEAELIEFWAEDGAPANGGTPPAGARGVGRRR
jgi:hypothetical protein